MSSRGQLIVLEGLDRSGKSTQVDRLLRKLHHEGKKARIQKFPGRLPWSKTRLCSLADRSTAIGKMIDAYLQSRAEMDDHAIHLLFSANRWECA